MIPIYVMTCNKYMRTLRGFAYLFNKYWYHEQPVTILGFDPPSFDLPNNFSFLSLGRDEDYPVNRWSDALLEFLHHPLTPKYFVMFLEDYWIKSSVNIRVVARAIDYCESRGDVLKLDLAEDRKFSKDVIPLNKLLDIDLLMSNPESQYHMSLYIGAWFRDKMKRVIVPGETPWQVELEGTNRLRAIPNLTVIGTGNNPVPITLAHRNGNSHIFNLSEFRCKELFFCIKC